jgi:hypothetical protein
MSTIKKGTYQHYKGNYYEVLDTVTHSEDESVLVLYRPLYGDQKLWVRPYDMFVESVIVSGKKIARFAFIAKPK